MRAADRNRIGVVRLLLAAPGANLSTRQESGATVLHIAAAAGHSDIVRLLVEHGADRSVEDRNGNTAAATAQSAGHTEIVEYLQSLDQPG